MKSLLALTALAILGCADPIKAGHYPRGFIIGSKMHYLNPAFGTVLYGPNLPIGAPLSREWVLEDDANHLYISPELAKKLAEKP